MLQLAQVHEFLIPSSAGQLLVDRVWQSRLYLLRRVLWATRRRHPGRPRCQCPDVGALPDRRAALHRLGPPVRAMAGRPPGLRRRVEPPQRLHLDGAQCVFEGLDTYQRLSGDASFQPNLELAARRMIRGTVADDGRLLQPNIIEIGEYAHFSLLAWKTTGDGRYRRAAELILSHIGANFDEPEGFWCPTTVTPDAPGDRVGQPVVPRSLPRDTLLRRRRAVLECGRVAHAQRWRPGAKPEATSRR